MCKTTMLLAGLLTLSLSCQAASPAKKSAGKEKTKPNIVFFLVDDMGPYHTSVPFDSVRRAQNDFYKTPAMERLASEGVLFNNAYACPVCSPSRVSLMTGFNAARHNVTNWTLNWGKTTDDKPRSNNVILPQWNYNGISPDPNVPNTCYTPYPLAAELKKCGYTTLHIGKAHFGANRVPAPYRTAEDPLRLGFDVNIGGWAGGGVNTYYPPYENGFGGQHGLPGMEKYMDKKGREGVHVTEALTREAIAAVDSARANGKPFFLYMSHYAVHSPFEVDDRYRTEYMDDVSHNQSIKAYATLVAGMDKSLGDLLDYLDKNDLRKNTIVIFMTDNGGYALGPHRNSNAPLGDGKGSSHQGGLRVPLMLSVPGGLKKARCAKPVIIEDVYMTLLEAAGADLALFKKAGADGESFLDCGVKRSPAMNKNRPLVFHFPNRWGEQGSGNLKKPNGGYGTFSAIIKGNMKYIFYYEPDRVPRRELFDLAVDPYEKKNLYTDRDARAKKLAKELQDYLEERGGCQPTNSQTGEVIKVD